MENSKQFIKSLAGFSLGPLGAAALQFISVPIQTWLVAPELGRLPCIQWHFFASCS